MSCYEIRAAMGHASTPKHLPDPQYVVVVVAVVSAAPVKMFLQQIIQSAQVL